MVVLYADPDGWYYERLSHLRVDGHSKREVMLHLRVNFQNSSVYGLRNVRPANHPDLS